jgi:hypothetical protein
MTGSRPPSVPSERILASAEKLVFLPARFARVLLAFVEAQKTGMIRLHVRRGRVRGWDVEERLATLGQEEDYRRTGPIR